MSWALFLTGYMIIGLGFWNILWLTHLRRRPGVTEILQEIPATTRILMVAIECIFWPALILFGLWKTIYERRNNARP